MSVQMDTWIDKTSYDQWKKGCKRKLSRSKQGNKAWRAACVIMPMVEHVRGFTGMTKPSDWVETIRLHLTGQKTSAMDLLSTQAMADKRQGAENVAGKPRYYAHSEGQFEVFPTPDGSYAAELLYIQQIPSLSDSATTNWLLTSYPDIYLYGSLLNSAPYLAEDGRAEVWARLYGEAVDKLNLTSEQAAYSGVGLTTKIRGLG